MINTARNLIVALLLAPALVTGQPAQGRNAGAIVDTYVAAHQREIVGELADLLAIPNVRADTAGIRRNAVALRALLARRGLTAEVIETAGRPIVWGELRVPGATRTLLLYAHYDGQAVNPRGWKQESPFIPVLRDGRLEDGAKEIPEFRTRSSLDANARLYARSASDDKAPIIALCAALDALKAAGVALTSNIRVLLDGEEESESPSLPGAIAKDRSRFAADLMVFLDGPVHASGRPTIAFGARGLLAVEITVYGPKMDLHSGHYGNWVVNPAMELSKLLASMKDDDGRVLVQGFYDGIPPLTSQEEAMLAAVPDDTVSLKSLFGLAATERKGLTLQQSVQLPSLNIRGLESANVGASARTVIPSRATAAIDVRLIKETPAAAMAAKVRAHVAARGFHVVAADPDDATRARHPRIARVVTGERTATNGYRTDASSRESQAVIAAMTRVHGERPVLIRTMGGTVPITPITDIMGFPAIVVPTVNFDNNQHSDNENLRLGTFFASIRTLAALLTM